MTSHEHCYAVIMAGGSGTRLWPMSRKHLPKQFQKLLGDNTPLQEMFASIKLVLPVESIFVQVSKRFHGLVTDQLPELPEANIIVEPEARDTGPAVLYAAMHLTKRDPDATMAILWSDHVVQNKKAFADAFAAAYAAAEDMADTIISIGVKPSFANTSLGYIQMKGEGRTYPGGQVFPVERFTEKPDQATADKFVKSWEYLWNTGYAVFKAGSVLALVRELDPEVGKTLDALQLLHAADEVDADKELEIFQQLPKISSDYLILEKTKKLAVIPADLDWSDIGSWDALYDMLSNGVNHHMVTKGNYVGVETSGSLVYAGERLIATYGVKNLVIVDTGDAILVADRNSSSQIKKLIAALEEQHKQTYL